MLRLATFTVIAALLAAAAFSLLAAGLGYALWRTGHHEQIADLSDGTLPLTFNTRSPGLQAKLKELAAKKELPNQFPPPEFEAVSQRLWASLAKVLNSEGFSKLTTAEDSFSELRAQEPRYADWPSSSSTPEQLADFLKFIQFHLDGALAPFKEDAPFLQAEEFTDSVSRVQIPAKRPSAAEVDITDLTELCKLKLFVALAEGKRGKALRMLDMFFKLASSPLYQGLFTENARLDAANCAAAMRKAPGWNARELKAFQQIVAREAARPFQASKMLLAERLETLAAFEKERLEHEKSKEALLILRDTGRYYDEAGLHGLLYELEDLYATLARNVDREELLELELIDALERRGPLKPEEVDAFLTALERSGDISYAENSLLGNYSATRSAVDTTLQVLAKELAEPVEKQPRKL